MEECEMNLSLQPFALWKAEGLCFVFYVTVVGYDDMKDAVEFLRLELN